MTSFKLNYFLQALSLRTVPMGITASVSEFEGYTIQFVTLVIAFVISWIMQDNAPITRILT